MSNDFLGDSLPPWQKKATVLQRQPLWQIMAVNRSRERRTDTRMAPQPNTEPAKKELSHSGEELW
jgi:hypothetical protein